MNIPLPAIEWPAALTCAGPEEDREIVLVGTATVDGVAFTVTGIRMREGQRCPDYRENVSEAAYETALERQIGDIEDLADSIRTGHINVNGSKYLLWMIPAPVD